MPRTLGSKAHRAVVSVLVGSRKEARLSQEQLAELLGETQSFVASIEAGQRRVDVVEFIRIARALKLDPKKLFERVVAWN